MSVFQLRPALLDPVLDGFLVALDRTSGWALPRPIQLVAQQIPHVSWVVADASQALDHFGHAWQRPHVGGVAIGLGPSGSACSTVASCACVSLRSRPTCPAERKASRPPRRHALHHSDTIWCDTPSRRAISAGITPRRNRSAACMHRCSNALGSRRGRVRRGLDPTTCFTGIAIVMRAVSH